jgi:6-pyruvoyltetrahydropterin/6-carboxytetrahydropterin synthase
MGWCHCDIKPENIFCPSADYFGLKSCVLGDFGGMKRAKTTMYGSSPKDFFNYLLDHTTIVAEDDPYLENFKQMDEDGIIQLRILPTVGCERFAEYLYETINNFLKEETEGRVKAVKVEVYEHERNSASYSTNG